MPNKQPSVRKIGLGLVLGWLVGLFCIVSGLAVLVSDTVYGIFSILGGLAVFPPFGSLLKTKFHLELSRIVKIAVLLVCLFIAGSSLPEIPEKNTTPKNAIADPNKPSTFSNGEIEITTINTNIVEKLDDTWKFSWTVTLKNKTDSEQNLKMLLNWVDDEEHVLETTTVDDVLLEPNEERTFTDFALINATMAKLITQANVLVQ